MKAERSVKLTAKEVFELENVVRELLWKGKRKRKAFTLRSLDIAVSDGGGRILQALGMCYPDLE